MRVYGLFTSLKMDKKIMLIGLVAAVLLVSGCYTPEEQNTGGKYCCDKCPNPSQILIKTPGGSCQCLEPCESFNHEGKPNNVFEYGGDRCCTDIYCTN